MRRLRNLLGIALIAAAGPSPSLAPDLRRVVPTNVSVTPLPGGVELLPDSGAAANGPETYATLRDIRFRDGEITVEVSGDRVPRAPEAVRGFVGIAFRAEGDRYEAFYLRMYNGRARDQLQRNHAAEYISHPDWPWERLRKEEPGVYESYVDLVPGRWTRMRVVVCGSEARLFVHGADQPTLVVHDLKRGPAVSGNVALWIGPGTVGRFRNLRIVPAKNCVPPA